MNTDDEDNMPSYGQVKEQQERRERAYNAVLEHQSLLLKQAIWHSCLNCINWHEVPMSGRTMQCRLYKATPPPHIIVHGCRDWEDDIPF